MPAPAVIPALIAYVKVVAVKTLVVGFRPSEAWLGVSGLCLARGAPWSWAGWAAVNRAQWRVAACRGLQGLRDQNPASARGSGPVGLALGTNYHD